MVMRRASVCPAALRQPCFTGGVSQIIGDGYNARAIDVGPNLPYLSRGVTRTSDLVDLLRTERFQEFVATGAVDLRPVDERFVCDGKSYDTGVKVLVTRARSILDNLVSRHDVEAVNKHGSAISWWARRWSTLTDGSRTTLEPVDFVLQFLGGERPFA